MKIKKRVQRFFSVLLTVCMMCSSIPVQAASVIGDEVLIEEIQSESVQAEDVREQSAYQLKSLTREDYTAHITGDDDQFGTGSQYGEFSNLEGTIINEGVPGETCYWKPKTRITYKSRFIEVKVSGLNLTEAQQAELNDVVRQYEENPQSERSFSFVMPESDVDFQIQRYFRAELCLDYTVTGGDVEIDNPTPITGEHVSITAIPDEGYRFVRWKPIRTLTTTLELDADETNPQNGFTLPLLYLADYTSTYRVVGISPVFEEIEGTSFQVTFTTEVGTGENPQSLQKVKGETFQLPENPYTSEDSTFLGWSDGTAVYQPGDSYTMPHKAVTFTAQWRSSTLHDVYFQAEPGSERKTLGVEAMGDGAVFRLPENTLTHSGNRGYDFIGWSDGSQIYQPGDSYTMGFEAVLFTAQWERYYKFTVDNSSNQYRSGWDATLLPEDNKALQLLEKQSRAPVGMIENLTWGMTYFDQPDYFYQFGGITLNGVTYTEDTILESTDFFTGKVSIYITGSSAPDDSGYAYGYVEFLDGEFTEDVVIYGLFEKQTLKSNTAQIKSFSAAGVEGIMNHNRINLYMKDTVDCTCLTPEITISEGATIVPGIGEEQDFTHPVIYTVTSKNGRVSQSYRVEINPLREAITAELPAQITSNIASNQDDTGKILGKENLLAGVSSTNTDWVAFGIGRYGYVQEDGSVQLLYPDEEGKEAFLAAMEEYIQKTYEENGGILSDKKATEWQRAILAIAALGGDPTSIGTYNGEPVNLVADGTYNCKIEPGTQGVNGEVFALIAKNTRDYDIPDEVMYSDEYLITAIMSKQLCNNGEYKGWNVLTYATESDPDMTGMVVQALAPYYWDATEYTYENIKTGKTLTKSVRQIVDEAIVSLSDIQTEYGDFISYGDRNVESTVQVLVALTAIGIDPLTDERFIKNGKTLIDGIQNYAVSGGGYAHTLGGGWNYMATDQGNYGMIAAWRYLNGMRSLYDMRPEFTDEQKEQIQTVKDTITDALAQKGTEGYYRALLDAKYAYEEAVTGFQDKTMRNYITNYWELIDAIPTDEDLDAFNVANQIAGLGTVTLDSEEAIQQARRAYDALTEADRLKVTNHQTLVEAEETFAQLKKEEEQKKLKAAADVVTAKIALLGDITLEDETTVIEAREAYDALSEQARELVTNYQTLVGAEETLAQLKEEEQKKEEEEKQKCEVFATGKVKAEAQAQTCNSIRVSWEAYTDADSYHIYRRNGNGEYVELAEVSDSLSYTDDTVSCGTAYYYMVQAETQKWGGVVSGASDTGVSAVTSPGQTKLTKAQSAAYNKVKLIWNKAAGADGYQISYKTSANGAWKAVTSVAGESKVSYTKRGLTCGKLYYFRVRAYCNTDDGKVYGAYSAVKKARPSLAAAKLKSVSGKKRSAKIVWTKVSGASGYQISYRTSKKGKWKTARLIKKGSTVTYTQKKLKSGKSCYYKIRAYHTVKGKKVYGSYSAVKSAKIR